MVRSPLVFCSTHGPVETAPFFQMTDSTLTITGGSAPCGVCGSQSPFIDGEYVSGKGPEWDATITLTPKQVGQLKQIQRWAQKRIGVDEAMDEHIARVVEQKLAEQAPEAKTIIDKARAEFNSNRSGWVAVLLILLQWITGGDNSGFTEDQLQHVIEQTVHQINEQQTSVQDESDGPDERGVSEVDDERIDREPNPHK
ncbi:hypothetical protein GCM10010915_11750 [Microbacterium faecale]|uniref:Uncharacterized protein n=1 Tax=Microbacterium faecale TaxID=1804630 RepID=A0A917DFK6_9MICO|nr:hypothetical protein [Microbacterium faecale]GGD33009.1 hypothetical protein GCM10010915_11750 [Microbacterium faecale]